MARELAPGEVALTEEQQNSTNWFWVAVRDANSYARKLQGMNQSERDALELKLLMG